MLSDDITWKRLCEKHDYRRRLSVKDERYDITTSPLSMSAIRPQAFPLLSRDNNGNRSSMPPFGSSSAISPSSHISSRSFDSSSALVSFRPPMASHKSYFRQRYLVENAWKHGGQNIARHITQDQGVVTSLHLTPKYIVVALDNAKIHVFDTDGNNQKTLQGHVMGVWAMIPWGDTLVSGGCDRDVRVWDMSTGYNS